MKGEGLVLCSLNIRGANISRLSNVAKNKIFVDLRTLPKCIRLYGGLNILRVKFSLITPKTTKSATLKYLGYTV